MTHELASLLERIQKLRLERVGVQGVLRALDECLEDLEEQKRKLETKEV